MKKRVLSLVMIIAMIVLAWLGVTWYQDKQYNAISIGIVMLSSIPFYFKYERSKPQIREIVVLAIMIALTIISRMLFMVTPNFKPITVLVIICGMVFSKESGFLCGSLGALLSNFFFGQGPWTPFQMLSWGLIGYGAGLLNTKGLLEKNNLVLYIYAIFAGIFYSMFMDLWTVLSIDTTFHVSRYIASLVTSLPMMITYVISNVVFMMLLKKILLQILMRVKIKYGMMEGKK